MENATTKESTPDAIVCDFLFMELDELGELIKEDPTTVRSWFTSDEPFKGNYFQVNETGEIIMDNSPVHNALQKREQLEEVVEHIRALTNVLGSERDVIVFLHRPRKKCRGRSLATIAKASPNPLPTDNGLQELIELIKSWFKRKGIADR